MYVLGKNVSVSDKNPWIRTTVLAINFLMRGNGPRESISPGLYRWEFIIRILKSAETNLCSSDWTGQNDEVSIFSIWTYIIRESYEKAFFRKNCLKWFLFTTILYLEDCPQKFHSVPSVHPLRSTCQWINFIVTIKYD